MSTPETAEDGFGGRRQTYKKNEIVNDVLNWFEYSIDFLNYGNPYQEIRTAIEKSDKIKELVLKMIREMDLDIEDLEGKYGADPYLQRIIDWGKVNA